jgi:hypothetical protein
MIMGSVKNIFINFIKPTNTRVIFLKMVHHWRLENSEAALAWAKENVRSTDDYFQNLDSQIWEESLLASREIVLHAKEIFSNIKLDLGGGGAYPILYFLTRKMNPKIIVETGVAAGWSSLSILTAIEKNGNNGKLFSSDFPLFRFSDPENVIGILVPEKLKKNWNLDIRGDDFALPQFIREIPSIDIFHYDSEKSYRGRQRAWDLVVNSLSNNAVVLFDDIQNNFHFRDLVQKLKPDFCVFEFQGKYIGLFHWDTRVLSD